jgi:CubicO group peptidase (beta-lactamase class C family)
MLHRSVAVMIVAVTCLFAARASAGELSAILSAQGKTVVGAGLLTIRDNRIADQAVYGVRRLGDPAPIKPDDVWIIGSDGKAMTAVMIARLVERGQLSWNARLADLWPEIASTMRPEYRSVPLLQLVTHQSGLPENIEDEEALNTLFYSSDWPSASEQRKAYVARALQDRPAVTPGRYQYSNTGFLLAAVLAERATGSSYESLMRKEVFEPLGMKSAGFGFPPADQPVGHMHGRVAVPRDENPEFFAPAGNIYVSLEDWARFCIDQMLGADGKGALLSPATYALVETPQPGSPVAMGWFTRDSLAGVPGPVLYHEGSDGAWFATVALFPKSGTGVLAVTNVGKDMGGEKFTIAVSLAALKQMTAAKRAGSE